MENQFAVLEERVRNMKEQNALDHSEIMKAIEAINCKLDKTFVTNERFEPVQKIVYGLITTILLTVIAALLAQVVTAY